MVGVKNTFKEVGTDILLMEEVLELSLCAHLTEVAECCEFRSPPIGSAASGELRSGDVLPFRGGNPLLASTVPLLMGAVKQVREGYSKYYQVNFSHAELYAIERYRPGQGHKRHVDGLVLSNRYQELAEGISARDVSVIGYLNDQFEGGELLFDRQKLKIKPPMGSVVIFPACYSHPYQSLPVLRGCKYLFLSWLFY
jgi:hypothetical protein